MKPTKSSVVKGSIAPNVGHYEEAVALKKFQDNIRGDKPRESIKKSFAATNSLTMSVIESNRDDDNTLLNNSSAAKKVRESAPQQAANTTRSRAVNLKKSMIEDMHSSPYRPSKASVDSIDLAILAQV